MKRSLLIVVFLLVSSFTSAVAQQPQTAPDPSLLTLDSIFTYQIRSLGPVQWQKDGSGYMALEPGPANPEAQEIVRYDAISGQR